MNASLLRLDHLVVSARTLDEGSQYVADRLGVAPSGGGAHPLMRTHNRLLNFYGGVYLEVIAIDPTAVAAAAMPARPRLFALDDATVAARLESGPYLSHWVARVERPKELTRWQAQYPARIPPAIAMTRGDFAWRLTVPDDGALPGFIDETGATAIAGDGVAPSLVQWDSPLHPSTSLPVTSIALKRLTGRHRHAAALGAHLRWLGADSLIALDSADGPPALVAEFDTPDGPRTLE